MQSCSSWNVRATSDSCDVDANTLADTPRQSDVELNYPAFMVVNDDALSPALFHDDPEYVYSFHEDSSNDAT